MALSTPKHFSFATDAIGLKTGNATDVLCIFSDLPLVTAAVFTQNTCPGAPVTVSKKHLQKNKGIRAILINAGIANVATGKKGLEDAEECAQLLAQSLQCSKEEILVSSTGKIGDFLPMEKMRASIPKLRTHIHRDAEKAAAAIMTTDLVAKMATAKVGNASILGIAKGSGMIAPNMATMLAFIMTDAKISAAKLKKKWTEIVGNTFNMVSVDNCESTSDMGMVFASGEYEVDEDLFFQELEKVARTLATKIARDGEGATVLIECNVNASSKPVAKELAMAIINSDLLKTAIHGKDPNWGRIAQAMGGTHLPLDIKKTSISIDNQAVFANGEPQKFDQKKMFQKDTVVIDVFTGSQKHKATAWGCDLSKEYITINALYHT